MRVYRHGALTLAILVMLFASIASQSNAQRPTRLYGSAYQQWWTPPTQFSYWPWCHVFVWDQDGNPFAQCDSNRLSDWWLDNVPSNRYYFVQAETTRTPFVSLSSIYVIYVPERSWWEINQTRAPDLVCHY
jgi:hypothetical protein